MSASLEVIGDMSREEWEETGRRENFVPAVREMKARHHLAARLVALGKSPEQVGEILGMTGMRVRQLMEDLMFQGLVEKYEKEVGEEFGELVNLKRMTGELVGELGLDMWMEIGRRFRAGQEMSIQQLFKIGGEMLKRTTLPEKAQEIAPQSGGGNMPVMNFIFEGTQGPQIEGEFKEIKKEE